jgi:hypothetical protein
MLLVCAWVAAAEMPQPRYTQTGELLRPEGYREWMFVGASIGMGYKEGESKSPAFHNIFIQRQAYDHFVKTGKFPDKTMLVMEKVEAGTDVSINKRGRFGHNFAGIEAAVKDESRFAEKWAYYHFIGEGGVALAKAKAFPKESCWNCHNEHAAVDNVFVQFYPVLKEHAARIKTSKHTSAPSPGSPGTR